MRVTHTFATLEVSKETFNEIYEKLAKAEYHQAFLENDTLIDMYGIALIKEKETTQDNNVHSIV